ncbi:parapinopsin b [Danio rerio]|uniref:Novel opsin n=1 Tax=Danio rerio TaxID=7955 RepID=Q8JFR3_DANRE|nr:parapinopsin b [Danio rerio]CAD43423.1 novel opsin [Danio rerio]|eukprot:NP_001005312.1 parapinopsin b [Danio rerio]
MDFFPEFLNDSSTHYDGPGLKVPLPRAGFITLSLLMAVFSITSVVLNATVIVVTLRHKQLRQPLNFALVNLAVADLGTTLTGSVPSVVTNAVGYYIMGRIGCVLEGFCVAFFGISALCTVALIAVERLFVVCRPLGSITFQCRHAAGGLLSCWLWSLIWNTPPLLGWGSYQLEGAGTSCGPHWQSRELRDVSYIICYFSVCFAVPFAIILVSYSWLLYTLRQVLLEMVNNLGTFGMLFSAYYDLGHIFKHYKHCNAALTLVLFFVVEYHWLPYAALALTVVSKPEVQLAVLVKVLPIYMAKSSTVYNPLIYIYMNKQVSRTS